MNRDQFINRFNEASNVINLKRFDDIIKRSIDALNQEGLEHGHYNLIIVMEELSELIKEVSKMLRKNGDRFNLIEEMADVVIANRYLQSLFGISNLEISKAVNVKVDRLERMFLNHEPPTAKSVGTEDDQNENQDV